MLSKNKIKQIQQLKQKKYRNKYGLFVVEGKKSVTEFLENKMFDLEALYYIDHFNLKQKNHRFFKISEEDLKKISFLKTPQQVVAIFKKTPNKKIEESDLIIALDAIQDPGNLGTIIRLADWFGVTKIVCSLDTVDCFNPKVVQATMGSLNRVELVYTNLNEYLKSIKKPVYAAIMDGDNVYQIELNKNAILLMGNETNKIAIPRFGENPKTESLNVATATAILLSEFTRS